MRVEDVPRVLEIERQSFAMAWTPEMFYKEISEDQDSEPLVALLDGQVLAYAIVWIVGPRLHLANIAVDPAFHRRGIGSALLGALFEIARDRGFGRVSLETRVSNRAAISLFRRMGFRTVTVSHGYYTDNNEDALVMVRRVEPESGRGPVKTDRGRQDGAMPKVGEAGFGV